MSDIALYSICSGI